MASLDREFWDRELNGLDFHLAKPKITTIEEDETIFVWREKSAFSHYRISPVDGKNR